MTLAEFYDLIGSIGLLLATAWVIRVVGRMLR